jgi:hypothetical protein
VKRLLVMALFAGTYDSAFAKDSDWRICTGEVVLFDVPVNLVVSSYEHRNGEGRSADLTFIYGGHVLHGSLDTSYANEGALKLTGYKASFNGSAALDFQKNTLALNGKVNFAGSVSDLNASLACEAL